MKLKYYMRGLGIGIIVTTIILSLGSKKKALSDTEIISQARELGMVMKDEETDDNLKLVLEKSLEKEDAIIAEDETDGITGQEETEDITNQDNTGAWTGTGDEDNEGQEYDLDDEDTDYEENIVQESDLDEENVTDVENIEDTSNTTEDASDQGTAGQVTSEPDTDIDNTITFTIVEGMSSGQVSELLKQKGLIEDVVDFDNYIKENGKSTIIRFGTFVLPRDASYSDILTAIVG